MFSMLNKGKTSTVEQRHTCAQQHSHKHFAAAAVTLQGMLEYCIAQQGSAVFSIP
jgi:hypothetical protein